MLIVSLGVGGSSNNYSQENEDIYREEYRNDPQAQSVYESEEEYIQDRQLEESEFR